ncbi:hypothetical protein [Nocardioides sp.]|uniref:hypothetical protein n=1 Tax=Nocardioides sp. TaxID=35761 RepID=UPI00286D1B48|nr:hypothetical protein [Nocardioides sp.]
MAAIRRKVLVPLATLVVAGSVAVGSGASFTSTTASTTAVSSGSVTHANNVSNMTIGNIKDDDVITGSVTITNTGTLPSTLTLAETTGGTNNFIASDLKLKLTQGTTELYNGTFGGLVDGTKLALGALQPGGSTTVVFTVTLDETTDNTNEGKSASQSFQWVSTQEAGGPFSFVSSLPIVGN